RLPLRNICFISKPPEANKQVNIFPSAESLARVHVEQKDSDTEVIKPTSAFVPLYRYRFATSPIYEGSMGSNSKWFKSVWNISFFVTTFFISQPFVSPTSINSIYPNGISCSLK